MILYFWVKNTEILNDETNDVLDVNFDTEEITHHHFFIPLCHIIFNMPFFS
jgi:hypothetical protein